MDEVQSNFHYPDYCSSSGRISTTGHNFLLYSKIQKNSREAIREGYIGNTFIISEVVSLGKILNK
ncbi:MAG: hypothetical protein QME57_01065, partial [Patescibacteria group bacterium]|nr:hypothetical protein [Patescibacteria group bacterium]